MGMVSFVLGWGGLGPDSCFGGHERLEARFRISVVPVISLRCFDHQLNSIDLSGFGSISMALLVTDQQRLWV